MTGEQVMAPRYWRLKGERDTLLHLSTPAVASDTASMYTGLNRVRQPGVSPTALVPMQETLTF